LGGGVRPKFSFPRGGGEKGGVAILYKITVHGLRWVQYAKRSL